MMEHRDLAAAGSGPGGAFLAHQLASAGERVMERDDASRPNRSHRNSQRIGA